MHAKALQKVEVPFGKFLSKGAEEQSVGKPRTNEALQRMLGRLARTGGPSNACCGPRGESAGDPYNMTFWVHLLDGSKH